jgi:hypothetical protein
LHIFSLELKVKRWAAARHSLGRELLQALRQDTRIKQPVAYKVHEIGELFLG